MIRTTALRGVQISVLCLFGTGLLAWAGTAQAIEGFGISPTSEALSLQPGQSTSGQMTVINDGDTNITYEIYATDYQVSGETYKGNFVDEGKGPNLSAVSWFTLPQGQFKVAARQEVNFDYKLTVPKTAAVGGHYAAVFIQTVTPPGSGNVIERIERVGTIFYLAVGGGLHQSGQWLGLSVPWLAPSPPLTASMRVQNTGNVHFLVTGTAQLSTWFGKVGTPVAFRGEVLPSTTREFAISMPETSPIGLFKVTVRADYLGKTVTGSGWTLVVPRLTFIIVGASLLLILIAGLWWFARRTRRVY